VPQHATASVVQVAGDLAYVGVGVRYHEGRHIGVLTMPRNGFAGDLVFCMPTYANVQAIAVEGDTMYVAISSGFIVRVRL
jgi:hypothetical protein